MNAMKYKGYAARVEYDAHDRIFVGHLVGVRDIVGFHGESVEGLETAFHEAVDNYLAACAKLGQQPNKPVSGKILLLSAAGNSFRSDNGGRKRGQKPQPVGRSCFGRGCAL